MAAQLTQFGVGSSALIFAYHVSNGNQHKHNLVDLTDEDWRLYRSLVQLCLCGLLFIIMAAGSFYATLVTVHKKMNVRRRAGGGGGGGGGGASAANGSNSSNNKSKSKSKSKSKAS